MNYLIFGNFQYNQVVMVKFSKIEVTRYIDRAAEIKQNAFIVVSEDEYEGYNYQLTHQIVIRFGGACI